jgi:hypothetical protein
MPANAFIVRQVTSLGAFKVTVEMRARGDNYGRFSSTFGQSTPEGNSSCSSYIQIFFSFGLLPYELKYVIYRVPNWLLLG